ncbi:MAG: NADH-quinone oxidoreductase subunit J family protein [Planctomycetota bacterium]
MSPEPLLFWTFAAVTVTGGLMAVLLPRIVHAVFSLLLSFGGVAAVYALAGADFLAIVQIVVYVGGVLVLIAYGVLLTGRTADRLGSKEVRHRRLGVVLGLVLFGGLLAALAESRFPPGAAKAAEPTTGALGALLLGDYLIAFEFASVLLLVALVGAAYLVRRADA